MVGNVSIFMPKLKIGARLRELRELKEASQYEVERETGISRKNLSTYENDRNLPPSDILAILSKYYHVSTDYIIFGEDKKSYIDASKYQKISDYIDGINTLDKEELKNLKFYLDRLLYVHKTKIK